MRRHQTLAGVVLSVVLGLVVGIAPGAARAEDGREAACVQADGSQAQALDRQVAQVNRIVAELLGENQQLKQPDPRNISIQEWLQKLLRDVKGTGIDQRPYVPDQPGPDDNYDCDDFAGDLEKALEALGYHATFTMYWCPPDIAHAVTDVHAPDGTVLWIEPQTGEPINLDFNGDGKVGVATKPKSPALQNPTEGDCRIEFYESRAAAEAAGRKMDN